MSAYISLILIFCYAYLDKPELILAAGLFAIAAVMEG